MAKFEDNISPYISFVEGSAPSSPAATNFRLYCDSADHLFKWKNSAGTVVPILPNPMTTSGDIIYGGASGVATRLAKGFDGQVLTLASGLPSWAAAAGGSTLTGARVTRTAGDLGSKNSTTFATLDASLTLTIVTGAHSVLVGINCTATITNAPESICLDVDLDGSRLGQTFGLQAADVTVNSKAVNMSFVFMTAALSAASHTFLVKYRVTGSTATFYASTGVTPFTFWVQEQPF